VTVILPSPVYSVCCFVLPICCTLFVWLCTSGLGPRTCFDLQEEF
jgi:hypothetical protein